MEYNRDRVTLIQLMIQEKLKAREELHKQLESTQLEIKHVDATLSAFQHELERLTGKKVSSLKMPLKGAEIGEAAVEVLKKLGGKAHYLTIKEEIEKYNVISGITEKSKGDSVWNYLNKCKLVEKSGRGEFKLKVL